MKIYRTKKSQQRIWATYDQLLAEWGVETEQADISTRYGLTRVNIWGAADGPPVVLFHGVGDDSALMWIYNAAALAPHFRLYAIDTIGGPGRSLPNGNYNKTFDIKLWIDEVLDGLELQRPHMAGVSHGGYLVQYYALVQPERVGKVVALAASVPTVTGGVSMKVMMKIFLPEALFPTRKNIMRLLTKLTGRNSAAFTGHPLIVEHFTYLLRGYNNMAMACHKVTGFTDAQIDMIRDKVLYLMGNADPFYKLGGGAALGEHQMNARIYDQVGHGINHEIADEINEILIRHFGE